MEPAAASGALVAMVRACARRATQRGHSGPDAGGCPDPAAAAHETGHYGFGEPGTAAEVTRTVDVTADDRDGMRFAMASIASVRAT